MVERRRSRDDVQLGDPAACDGHPQHAEGVDHRPLLTAGGRPAYLALAVSSLLTGLAG